MDQQFNHDSHVRAWYDQPLKGLGKFEGERRAVEEAYKSSMNGFVHDDFGSVEDVGYHARVLFDGAPFIVCFRESGDGFVSEMTNEAYELAHIDYVETSMSEEMEDVD
jgi:hypothetical protein